MTLDEAINHAEEVAEENRNVDEEELGLIYCDDTECIENHKKRCFKCADEHEQLAEWLRDYKRLLEQQPCEDCVSRAEAMTEIQMNARRYTMAKEFGGMGEVEWSDYLISIKDALDILRNLPSVAPKTNWIPVSERLPDDEQMVLVCSNTGNIEVSCGSRSTEIKDKFIWYTSGWKFGEVAAWMPLPEPYQEE